MSLIDSTLSPNYWNDTKDSAGEENKGLDNAPPHGGYAEYKNDPFYKMIESPMKILAIGDVHGRDVLSRIEPDNYDKIVFIGDYCDSHDMGVYNDFRILDSLKKIIEFKKACPGKVILLLGNHDVHYMYPKEVDECSGFRKTMLADLQTLFLEHSSLFDMAYQYKTTLFTHAGVSVTWYMEYNAAIYRELRIIRDQTGTRIPVTLGEKLNYLRNSKEGRKILFTFSGLRTFPQDLDKAGGIIWADQEETDYDYLKNYHQVVGHTVVASIEKKMDYHDDKSSITYIDTQSREFLELSI